MKSVGDFEAVEERGARVTALVLRALAAMDRDCKGATIFEDVERASYIRSNFLSIMPRLSPILAELFSLLCKTEQASSSLTPSMMNFKLE